MRFRETVFGLQLDLPFDQDSIPVCELDIVDECDDEYDLDDCPTFVNLPTWPMACR